MVERLPMPLLMRMLLVCSAVLIYLLAIVHSGPLVCLDCPRVPPEKPAYCRLSNSHRRSCPNDYCAFESCSTGSAGTRCTVSCVNNCPCPLGSECKRDLSTLMRVTRNDNIVFTMRRRCIFTNHGVTLTNYRRP